MGTMAITVDSGDIPVTPPQTSTASSVTSGLRMSSMLHLLLADAPLPILFCGLHGDCKLWESISGSYPAAPSGSARHHNQLRTAREVSHELLLSNDTGDVGYGRRPKHLGKRGE